MALAIAMVKQCDGCVAVPREGCGAAGRDGRGGGRAAGRGVADGWRPGVGVRAAVLGCVRGVRTVGRRCGPVMRAPDWDQRYATAEYVWHTEPNQFLPLEVLELPVGRALDLASGEGRNAVWLARQGWQVTGIDFSHAGIAKGARLAADHDVSVEWCCADATTWSPSPVFDLVVVFYLQLPADGRRAAFEHAARALAPAGTLLIVGHASANLTDGVGGPQDPSVLYSPEDVRTDVEAAGVADLVVERAEHVRRRVQTPEGGRDAIDCLLRAHRTTEETR